MSNNILYIVVPCYNEEEVLPETAKRLLDKLNTLIKNNRISSASRVLFVNDGSKDETWDIICKLHNENEFFSGLCLSRNKGHQYALLSGLMYAKDYADMVISIDADLQDDINAIDKMIDDYYDGNDIVYGVRNTRKTDSWFKRTSAQVFYKLMRFLGADIVYNHADYRLMSKRALEALEQFDEVNMFLRGIVPLIGYKSSIVYYERSKRFAGTSKYPFKKMLAFAWDGITSFSIKPIRLVLSLGIIIFIISLLITLYSIIVKFIGYTVDGWTFLSCSIWMVAGIQMLSLGIIGEYIGKIYSETKQRPKYFVSAVLNKTTNV